MKITEETKIKDLIPEGYYFDRSFEVIDLESNPRIELAFKPQQQKDFAWYVGEYSKSHVKDFGMNMCDMKIYPHIFPFELRIGLFRFICNDLNLPYIKSLRCLSIGNGVSEKLKQLLPKQFIDSLI